MLKIRLLGQFDLELAGESRRLPSRQAQSLLAYLLLEPGRNQRREKLAGLIWPDLEEKKARDRLRYALWQLRQVIGEQYIVADKIAIGINQELPLWVDVAMVDEALAQEMPLIELSRCLGLYEGDLLPGFYDDWVIVERERLAANFENKVGVLVGRLAAGQHWREVTEWAEKWIALGNVPEPAYRAMMVAYSQLGDTAGAINTYRRCEQALFDDLAVKPSAATRQLLERIEAGETVAYQGSEGAGGPSGPGHGHPRSLPISQEDLERRSQSKKLFVARDRELAWLGSNLDLACQGQGRVVFVRGDAGRGKSALLREFSILSLDRIDKLIVSWGSGEANTGQGDPHLPFRDMLSLLTGDIRNSYLLGETSMVGLERIWRLLPETSDTLLAHGADLIGSFVSGPKILARAKEHSPGGAAWSDRLEQYLQEIGRRPAPLNVPHRDLAKDLFEQVTKVLQTLARQRPLLILLDDLHWADLGSIQLLFHLGRRIGSYPIMIVGGYRPAEVTRLQDGKPHALTQVLFEFKRNYGDNEIDLDQADELAIRHFGNAILDSEPNRYSDDFRRVFLRHTAGHPLFTIELLRQLQETGEIRQDEAGRWTASDNLGWQALPARIEAVIAGRIGQLPASLKEILRVASVEGENFTAEVVAQVTGIDTPLLIRLLSHELAKHHRLVEATGTQRIGRHRLSSYRFRHYLYQKFVYESLDSVERVHLHEQVGLALESLYGQLTEPIDIHLALHFEEAGVVDKAIDYLLQAGQKAKRLSANEEAIAHLNKGLRLLAEDPDSRERTQKELAIHIALGAPLVAVKGYTAPEVEHTFDRARVLCEQVNDPNQLATALWGLWSFYLVRAEHETARDLAEQIRQLAESTQDQTLLLVANWTLGITLVHLGQFTESQQRLQMVIDHYDPKQHQHLTYLYGQNPAVTCLVYAAYALWFLGYPDQAYEHSLNALAISEEIDHPYSRCFALGMVAIFHGVRRDPQAAVDHAQIAARLAKTAGFPFLLGLSLVMRGWARAALGKASMTLRQVQGGIEAMDLVGAELGRPLFLAFYCNTLRAKDLPEEALVVVNQAMSMATINGERFNESDLYRIQGKLLSIQGKPVETVEENILESVKIARQQRSKSMELRALLALYEIWRGSGQEDQARKELRDCYEWFSEGFETADLIRARQILE